MHLHSTDQKTSCENVAASMQKKLRNDPRLTTRLIPEFALGCRRMTPGSDHLQSLWRENVAVITDSAAEFTMDGIVDASGTETKVDVIICATGFDVTRPSYNIIGRDGRNLGEWTEFPKGNLSVMADGFPNLFCEYTPSLKIDQAMITAY
jgi:cation diffusion facilitator CzcD-associated flavoprotein CzcO